MKERPAANKLWNMKLGLLMCACTVVPVEAVALGLLSKDREVAPAWFIGVAGVGVLAFALLMAAYLRSSVTMTDAVIQVRNPFRSYRFSMEEVSRIKRATAFYGRYCAAVEIRRNSHRLRRRSIKLVALSLEDADFIISAWHNFRRSESL